MADVPSDIKIRLLTENDREAALAVINTAARWYREFLPTEEYHDPEMTSEDWAAEAKRLSWYGAFGPDRLLGVMGLEYVKDVTLLRHAYILPDRQRHGIGSLLRAYLERQIRGVRRIVVGTYADNYKARSALEAAGYTLSADPASVLRAYYAIPEDRLQSSVTYEERDRLSLGEPALHSRPEQTGYPGRPARLRSSLSSHSG